VNGPARGTWRGWLLKAAAAPLCAAALLAGVWALARSAREDLRGRERYIIPIRDIDFTPPASMKRDEFLEDELQFNGHFPAEIDVLDDGAAGRLRDAYAHSPWVEEVRRVEVTRGHARVEVMYREPVLAIRLKDGTERAVDRHGVLLPEAAKDPAAPVLDGAVNDPAPLQGTPLTDARVGPAARTAAFLRPHREQVAVKEIHVEADVVTLKGRFGQAIWGRPPGEEGEEPSAASKARRLLDLPAPPQDAGQIADLRSMK
jgi:hypothetical protein